MNPAPDRTFRVGLTGGIASGKTTVAHLFSALGVPVIDTDQLARDVVAPGTALLSRLVERFGAGILASDASLDRRALRAIVFADPAARADLEAMTHPAIHQAMEAACAIAGGPYQMLVIPLLVDKNLGDTVDRVLVVDCSEALQIRRLQARDGSTLEQARSILAAQVPRAVRLQAADDVVTNEGDLHAVREQVEKFHAHYLQLAREARP